MIAEKTLQERLADLTKVYVGSLPKRLSQIEEEGNLWADGDSTADRGRHLKALHNSAHKLAGSAATYGFHDLGSVSRELEVVCHRQLEDSPGRVSESDVSAIFALISIVVDHLNRVISSENSAESPVRQDDTFHASPRIQSNPITLVTRNKAAGGDIQAQLNDFGYQVTIHETPRKMLNSAESRAPMAIIVDGEFDDDVLEGGVSIKATKASYGGIPEMIFVSPRDDLIARLAAVRADCQYFLTQPLDAMALIDILDSSIEDDQEPCRVLLVDDDEDAGGYIDTVLKNAGMITSWLTSPDELIDRVTSFSPEIILMDLYLPTCSGYELAAVVRQHDRFTSIPIVYLSGEQDHRTQIKAIEHGGDDFLTKPIAPDLLIRSVKAVQFLIESGGFPKAFFCDSL